jgi:hypothetical protein
MLVSTRYLQSGVPPRCAFCGQPFPLVDGQAQAWRSSGGAYFCSEFCADDAEEAEFRSHRSGGGELRFAK